MSNRICAIVVTYNRKSLLKECLESLIKQTHLLDGIYIVDNASTDGTETMLFEEGYISEIPSLRLNSTVEFNNKYKNNIEIHYLRMHINSGGAGGFYEGTKRSYQKGYDWVWIMDDDVIPQEKALESLLEATKIKDNIGFLCSRVIGTNRSSMNVPQLDLRLGKNYYPDWEDLLDWKMVKVRSATFVSVLINRKVIKKVGLPIKEMFIWGDDIEYTSRISDLYPCYLVGDSVVVHKRAVQTTLSLEYEQNKNRINHYYYLYRNTVYNNRKYIGKKQANKYVIITLLSVLKLVKTKNAFKRTRVMISGVIAGLTFNPKVEQFNS